MLSVPIDWANMELRSAGQPSASVISRAGDFRRLAREWDARMRNRNRWIGDENLRTKVADQSRIDLTKWGIGPEVLVPLARAGVVEVLKKTAPFGEQPADLREMQRMPWESLLTMAARRYQNHEKLLVYRRLDGLGNRAGTFSDRLQALFVESAPGALWGYYDFDWEFDAVKAYLQGMPVDRLQNPSLAELRQRVAELQPAVIHLSGFDGYQGFSFLQQTETHDSGQTPRPMDGAYFRGDSGEPEVAIPEAVAGALCAGLSKPILVTFNLYNSSAGLAAEAVKHGAAAAIGFQDFIDDTIGEVFFANLFQEWSERAARPLLYAFNHAVRELDVYADRVRGSGVTLWTSEPLLENPMTTSWPGTPKAAFDGKGTGGAPEVVLKFDVVPYDALNYSVLHNGKKKMFESFRIYKFGGDEEIDVRVEVNLNAGGYSFPFRQSFTMKHHILDLTEGIAVALTSSLSRSLRESVLTTIFVRVTLGADKERYCQTFNVSLLAVDEWIDDESSGIFLPSFVLPRDPMIPEVIAKAHRYLMALADDSAQGFDGYQSCDEAADNPADALEPQTRAIWYALQYDYALRYINPPPTFTERSQRLRTPSEVLRTGRGTCIDLALLLAACFELIGLHSVVFLLKGHAFAGYWADEQRREDFRTISSDPTAEPVPPTTATTPQTISEELPAENLVPPVEWKYEADRLKEIQEAVKNWKLVAVEATYLANGGSFADACEVGASNLDELDEFDSMLDISLARDNGVTPLPLTVEDRA